MNYPSLRIEGSIVTPDILERLGADDYPGQSPRDYGFSSKVKDEIAFAWADAKSQWAIFRRHLEKDDPSDPRAVSRTRKYWTLPLLDALGYRAEASRAALQASGKSYNVSHRAANRAGLPMLLPGWHESLDERMEKNRGGMSPHSLVQEYLNLTEDHLYALVCNGRVLRLLREANRLVRLSYVEFDLEKIMEEDLFADFAALFRLLHASRTAGDPADPAACLLEQYHLSSLKEGERIRDGLSRAVEESLKDLAEGFLSHPANGDLLDAIRREEVDAREFSHRLLLLVYRLLFLMVIEERDLVFAEGAEGKKRDIYYAYYSVSRMRRLCERERPEEADAEDLWTALRGTFRLFHEGGEGLPLDVKPLGGELFGSGALGILSGPRLRNGALAGCLRRLDRFYDSEGRFSRRVNYGSLNVEEFGSVYEGLLELEPALLPRGGGLRFDFVRGDERSRTGTHFTPEELTQPLVRNSLEHLIAERLQAENPEEALLGLAVCDPACGSGHILLSAARRLGLEIARARTGFEQPPPPAVRAAVRDAIRRCVYGVDKNPLAVELCKVALWLEGHSPGEPLSFLDHHIKCGDSLAGLRDRREILDGIDDEAFRRLPGDDETAAAWKKRNAREREARGQTYLDFEKRVYTGIEDIGAVVRHIEEMPERTPEELAAKKRRYEELVSGPNWRRLAALADLRTAQFFLPKTKGGAGVLCSDGEYGQFLSGERAIAGDSRAEAAGKAGREKRFFHWFLEFPEVFARGGFDCLLGNPPFLGNRGLRGAFGVEYLHYLTTAYAPAGAIDLAGYFFRRAFDLLADGGFFALISTNTIAQGGTREGGLEVIEKRGGRIVFAVRSTPWPGLAAVSVSLVAARKGDHAGPRLLDGRRVGYISSYLDDAENLGSPFRLERNAGKSFQGSIVLGMGFVLEPGEAEALIARDPRNRDVVFPYLNGEDLNSDPEQRPSRYVINFFDWPLEKAREYPDCYRIVEEKVKPERQRKKADGTYALRRPLPEKWWIYADKRPALYRAVAPLERVMVTPQVSKYSSFCLVPNSQVISMMCIAFSYDSYLYISLLSSTIHDEWTRYYSSSLESRRRYTPTDAFETFPFPPGISLQKRRGDPLSETEAALEKIGEEYHEFRADLMRRTRLGLTKLYNQFHNPGLEEASAGPGAEEAAWRRGGGSAALGKHLAGLAGGPSWNEVVRDIKRLRDLHRAMDLAVLAAYGWDRPGDAGPAVDPAHGFYDVDYLPENDRTRYTISPAARREILKRLLLLNHRYHAEEEAARKAEAGKGGGGKGGKRGKRKAGAAGPELGW